MIDVTETGVVENTTERTTLKCQASGKPVPVIELNLYDHYGPNLIQTGIFQVCLFSPITEEPEHILKFSHVSDRFTLLNYFKPASNFILLIVSMRYFCDGSYGFMS